MAQQIRTIDLLPEIFQTDSNKQILSSTLDQLVQEPKLTKTQGYIGRKIGGGVNPNDNYVLESDAQRSNYQLEPAVVFNEPNTNTANGALTYPGLINLIQNEGGNTSKYDRLFKSEKYSWDPFVDFDKFVNFGQYFWLPDGPDPVDVSATDIPLTDDFTVSRTSDTLTFSGEAGNLPTLYLARQGNYTFDLNQPGNPFWIQAAPGADGLLSFANQSSREVLGVTNNGEDQGTITFNVPSEDAQNFYFTLTDDGSVDLVSSIQLDDINNVRLSTFLAEYDGIDNIRDLDQRTVVFLETKDGLDGGWTLDGSTEITDAATKYAVWRINFSTDDDPIMTLSVVREIANLSKLEVNFGTVYGGGYVYKDANGYYVKVPLITANLDTLYYQDVNNPDLFGEIKLVNLPSDAFIDINKILSSSVYTSPNGVSFTNGLKVQFEGNTVPASYSGNTYYVEGVGTQITLHNVLDFVTPEKYTKSETVPFDSVGFDIGGFESSLNAPLETDYLTINRASGDLNPWTRSNRWFHIDVINVTAEYNNTVAVLDNNYRAKRPILEYKAGLKLYDFGTEAIANVDAIDFIETDAFSNINGSIGYTVDGYSLAQGSTVIFANDLDPAVRNKIYTVNIVRFDDSSEEVIDLQPADITVGGISINQCVVILSGIVNQGKSFVYNGTSWTTSQQKISINQAPLFDVFDAKGYSLGDETIYQGSSFTGSKLFSYAIGTGRDDSVLGFALKYQTLNNVGDIVFDNYLYNDTFNYVSNSVGVTENVSTGTVRKYSSRTAFQKELGWQTTSNQYVSRQIFSFEYNGYPLTLDVPVKDITDPVAVKVFVNNEFIIPTNYTTSANSLGNTVITFSKAPNVGDNVQVSVISDTASNIAYYTVASNLENNAVNINNKSFTLGTARNHYNTICQNINDFSGKINGANNIRDLGNVGIYGDLVLQQSSPLTFASSFLYQQEFEFFRALEYSGLEYEKFKNLILYKVANKDWSGYKTADILDEVVEDINFGKTKVNAFYWTDTLPHGKEYTETSFTFTNISTYVFDTLYSYDFTKANYQGINVYLNDTILNGDGHDYTVATDGPRITINSNKITLAIGDVIKIREYTTVYGSFVPATPASMGLDKIYEPEKFLDNTYITPTNVIRGHDGSLTVAYNDIRDDVLLEFESRIYSNIKVVNRYSSAVDEDDIVSAAFRTNDYSLADANTILSVNFLKWVATNKLDYKDQNYQANNEFTYNYSTAQSRINGELLLGGWRGIYQYYYDTDSPHTRPWEMLGITEQPTWWEDQYGPAPYTSGNLVLWRDLRDGKINDPAGATVVNKFKRPQLLSIIPTDSEGNLLSPLESIVGNYDQNSFQKSWVFGDQGPVETAWRRSSSYRFAVQRLLALTRPAQYFALFSDLDRYRYNADFSQYLYDNRYRLNTNNVEIYGNGVIKNSYINWIVDYNRTTGVDSTTLATEVLENIDLKLMYRMGGFSDQKYLKIFSEKSTPNSQNASLLLPDESYQIPLYKNPALTKLNYSAVIVKKVSGGWSVQGYNDIDPYFTISKSITNGNFSSFTINGQAGRIAKDFTNTTVNIPYGYVFTTRNAVVDFLISYGHYLESQGFIFDFAENYVVLTWAQIAQEFMYWSTQGWQDGSIINLNPSATQIKITTTNSVIDSLSDRPLLNQNAQPLGPRDYFVSRIDNTMTITALNNNSIAQFSAKTTAYEHALIFDNTSIFNDLLYDPGTGLRQSRLLLDGYRTYDWNGTLNAQGFILNQDNVKEWKPNRTYSKGEIVLYKDNYWSASKLLSPTETFDFNTWIKSDYEEIAKGLLPNIATKAELVRNYYDTKTANLEQDADLLAFGLIGFRPREYMQNLDLDDISQVNLYQQFLGTKGTITSAEIFTQANLGKEVAEYNIFENWAIRRAVYGANANRRYVELQLDESILTSNPSSVAIIQTGDETTADQQILIEDIYKESYKVTDTNIFPTTLQNRQDVGLPSAGYVNYDDVEIRVFNTDTLTPIVENIEQLLVGTSIWVAKDNSYTWNVYNTNLVTRSITQVKDNLDGTCTLTFNGNHGLTPNEVIVIKYFSNDVNGSYRVQSVPSLKTIKIALSLPNNVTTLSGLGVVFLLESVRVSQASDISNLGFVNSIVNGSKAWADDDGTGRWAAYQKNDPFASPENLLPPEQELNNEFGTVIKQGIQKQGLIVSAPGYNSNVGGVYCYNKIDTVNPIFNVLLSPSTTGVVGLGDSLDMGNTGWAVAGAPQSLSARGYAFAINRNNENGNYSLTQCIVENATSASSQFGNAVTISKDEHWMAVSALGDDKVYIYQKNSVQSQSLKFTGDGTTRRFKIDDTIIIDDDSADGGIGSQQIIVTVNSLPTIPNVEWVYGSGEVAFTTPPNEGDVVFVARKQSVQYFPSVSTTVFSTEDLYTIDSIYSFRVIVNDVLQRPYLDYTYNNTTKEITFLAGVTGPVVITSETYWKNISTIDMVPGDSASLSTFGYSLDTTTDGRQLTIGSPYVESGDEINGAGKVYVYDRRVERFSVTNASDYTYTTETTPIGTAVVKLNGKFLQPTPFNNNGQFTISGKTVTIDSSITLVVGDIIEIETNVYTLMQSIEPNFASQDANFGSEVAQCGTNCSLYVGSPKDSTYAVEGGTVERWINQNRLYGIITSKNTRPILNPGDSIRINNYNVAVSTPTAWVIGGTYVSGVFVLDGTSLYRALQAVPAGTAITNTDYWRPATWTELYANDITTADIPNVQATYNSDTTITLSLVNVQAGDEFIKLIVLPGIGGAWTALGFEPMVHAQTVTPPYDTEYGNFGTRISVENTKSSTVVISAPNSSARLPTTFDNNATLLDSGGTLIIDPTESSGIAFTYDILDSANSSATNPAKMVFGQQLYDSTLTLDDQFGKGIDFSDGLMVVGVPGSDNNDSVGNYGKGVLFANVDTKASWQKKYQQQDQVDIELLNSVSIYNKLTSVTNSYLDYIDPLAGKILGSVKQNLDYIISNDPARYNTGSINNNGTQWADSHIGEIWWDTRTVRFIDYHQDTIAYKTKRWGQLFPGSSVDIYQWVESTVTPANYSGPGTVYSTTSYTVSSKLGPDGVFRSVYYFWVKGLVSVATNRAKTLSVSACAQYIENPLSSGIPYLAPLSTNSVALFNARNLISATDSILHIEFDKIKNDDNVHVEYDLIADGEAESFLGDNLYRKLLDSFCGADTIGNKVPDVTLSEADLYGLEYRPRQSMFVDRFLALENYMTKANSIMAQYPIAEIKPLDLLLSEEAEPTSASGQWDKKLATYAELTYQDLRTVDAGYKYLVSSDETNAGLWTIYTVQTDKTLLLSRVQNYDTKKFWSYIDWVLPGYDTSLRPIAEVATFNDLQTVSNVTNGDSVLVTANSYGKREIYQYISGTWNRVFAEDTTIAINSTVWNYVEGFYGYDVEVFDGNRFDQNPILETRQILKALNQEIFTDDLIIHRNSLLILMFQYILTEQNAPNWLFKTSLVDIDHKIRDLLPYPTFIRDNQDFVIDYIKEVKPYHTKIREFVLRYEGDDAYPGNIGDFDLPAYYDADSQKFISPQLGADTLLSDGSLNYASTPSTDPIWQTWPWSQWYDNYTLSLESVTVVKGGSGYTVAPQVTVTGTATTLPVLRARINTAGEVIEIIVVSAGTGYSSTPVITLSGGNGSGAIASPVMGNSKVRAIKPIIKFDRNAYTSSVVDWTADTTYEEGTLVRYNNKVYSVNAVADSTAYYSGASFDPDFYTEVDQSTLSGVDRVMGLYNPTANQPARQLAQVMAGIEYPGVQVDGPGFDENTGFDVGNFDINPFDNLDFGPEGRPTYSESILDSIYQSAFTDTYLGTRTTDINVDGSEFIDTYSSHAPEELVPGSNFDTLDLRVATRPGADWTSNGHGFNIQDQTATFSSGSLIIDFSAQQQNPVGLLVYNQTTRILLNNLQHFTVNWPTNTVTITDGASSGDIIEVKTLGVGGGDQIFKQTFPGDEVGNTITLDIAYDEIYEFFIVVNGVQTTAFSYAEGTLSYQTKIDFDNTYDATDQVTIVALGTQTVQQTWSSPRNERFVYDGSTLSFILTESLQGSNPVNLEVFQDGKLIRPPESIQYQGDGSSAGPYYLPTRGATSHGLVTDSEVYVYVDDEPQQLSVDFTVSDWDGSSDRYVEFNTPPDSGSSIVVSIFTSADYYLTGNQLVLLTNPAGDAVIDVYTYNDTNEQAMLTQVYQGPTSTGTLTRVPFDQIGFDDGDFDATVGSTVDTNELDVGVTITNTGRIEVYKNGFYQTLGEDYNVTGSVVEMSGSILGPGDVVVIKSYTMQVTPESMKFRIFQDMLGTQNLQRIIPASTTKLARALAADDTTIYVDDASKLGTPDIAENILGVCIINGERITYRTRNTSDNTITGLRRGVAGTAIASHAVDSEVTDAGINQTLANTYQKQTTTATFTGDGSTKRFETTTMSLNTSLDSTEIEEAVRVSVGGTVLSLADYEVSQLNPIEVLLVDAPASGVRVEVSIVTSKVMYAQGSTAVYTASDINWSASDGVAGAILLYVASGGSTSSSSIGEFIGTIASDGFKYGDFSLDNSVTSLDALVAAQYGAGTLADGATKTRIIDVFIPNFLAARAADPTNFNAYFNTPGSSSQTASNGIPLQEQTTSAARFIRGEF